MYTWWQHFHHAACDRDSMRQHLTMFYVRPGYFFSYVRQGVLIHECAFRPRKKCKGLFQFFFLKKIEPMFLNFHFLVSAGSFCCVFAQKKPRPPCPCLGWSCFSQLDVEGHACQSDHRAGSGRNRGALSDRRVWHHGRDVFCHRYLLTGLFLLVVFCFGIITGGHS